MIDTGRGPNEQKKALAKIADLIAKGSIDPTIVRAARAITADVRARDDRGELDAIYEAVKSGTDRVPGMEHGFRYVADPRTADYYVGAARTLKECQAGACSGDCDEHTVLVAALAGALGFKVGARAYGPNPKVKVFEHVYAVAAVPKRGPWKANSIVGLDTTVSEAYPGWEPPRGCILTYWIEEG